MGLRSFKQLSIEEGVNLSLIKEWAKKGFLYTEKIGDDICTDEHAFKFFMKRQNSGISYPLRILKSDPKNFTAIELFSGAGGLALGFENAGFQHVLVSDNDKDCLETIKLNRPRWPVVNENIKIMNFNDYDADIITGGYPCQPFSYAGNKEGFGDTRGTLFFDFSRAVRKIQPKVVVAENVKGLASHDKGRTIKTMVVDLIDAGYNVKYKVLPAQFYDVPQKRERVFIVATRNDLPNSYEFPKPNPYVRTVRDALENIPDSNGMNYSNQKKKILSLVPEGGNWKDLPISIQREYMGKSFYSGGGKTGVAKRLAWDEPCLTLTCSPAQKQTERCHPEETRPLTVREYARIQTFPDEWKFFGSMNSQYHQIGNAVPVNLAYWVGISVIEYLESL